MRNFISIDFETANPKRVSACAFGYARVENGKLTESGGYLVKPVGGHAPFQSRIHGIKEEHTFDKPDFGKLYDEIHDIFRSPLVAHSAFDRQVLSALSEHFRLGLNFEYLDTCGLARQKLPSLDNHKLKTLVKHFGLPKFKEHDAMEDAIACASVFLRLSESMPDETPAIKRDVMHELKGMIIGILADNEVNYKEAYELLYWLEDRNEISAQFHELYSITKEALEDDELDKGEARAIKARLRTALSKIEKLGI